MMLGLNAYAVCVPNGHCACITLLNIAADTNSSNTKSLHFFPYAYSCIYMLCWARTIAISVHSRRKFLMDWRVRRSARASRGRARWVERVQQTKERVFNYLWLHWRLANTQNIWMIAIIVILLKYHTLKAAKDPWKPQVAQAKTTNPQWPGKLSKTMNAFII